MIIIEVGYQSHLTRFLVYSLAWLLYTNRYGHV